METSEVARAIAAATAIASELDLTTEDAAVLSNSNKLAVRLMPCDVLARVAYVGREVAQFEVDLAQQLARNESPVGALEPRVAPRVYTRDGFAVTLWIYYDPALAEPPPPAEFADALHRLHAGMRHLDIAAPHFTDRVEEAQHLVSTRDRTPALADADREFLDDALRSLRRTICDRRVAEQLLHGEPHPGNVLNTKDGLRFIDLETCCRGPIAFDLAHVPVAVSACYPGADQVLIQECRGLVLAMVAAWRWDADDQFPDGIRMGRALLSALRRGPPWPALDAVVP